MAEVDRFRPEDRRNVDALYRRVFGNDAADASRLRWDWQYRLNPNNPGHEPEIWIAREGTTIVGQYATMPVKPMTRRAFRRANWPVPLNRLVSALMWPIVKIIARTRPLGAEVRMMHRFDDSFTALWNELAPHFELAIRRDAAYLNWKYVSAPHVRYSIASLRRNDRNVGYAVYRHVHEPRGRVTLLVDFLTAPDDEAGLNTLLRWVDREARAADSDKIRTFAMHAGFRRVLRRAGYFQVKSTMEFVVKVNSVELDPSFYEQTDRWHVTLGDSDQDR